MPSTAVLVLAGAIAVPTVLLLLFGRRGGSASTDPAMPSAASSDTPYRDADVTAWTSVGEACGGGGATGHRDADGDRRVDCASDTGADDAACSDTGGDSGCDGGSSD
jgi:hypothetical protein